MKKRTGKAWKQSHADNMFEQSDVIETASINDDLRVSHVSMWKSVNLNFYKQMIP